MKLSGYVGGACEYKYKVYCFCGLLIICACVSCGYGLLFHTLQYGICLAAEYVELSHDQSISDENFFKDV